MCYFLWSKSLVQNILGIFTVNWYQIPAVSIEVTYEPRTWLGPIYMCEGLYPRVVSIWWMITWLWDCLSPLKMLPLLSVSRIPYSRNNENREPSKFIPESPSSKRICHTLELCFSLPFLLLSSRLKFLLLTVSADIWDPDLYPTGPLLLNLPFYASSHPVVIFQ